VGITPGCGFVNTTGAFVIGLLVGILIYVMMMMIMMIMMIMMMMIIIAADDIFL
jgi:ammonia channel protein AmtB